MTAENHDEIAMHTRKIIRDGIQTALTAAGYEKPEHNRQLQNILKITQSSAYRKLTTEAGWTDTDLAEIAMGLNISAESLFAIISGFKSSIQSVPAKMHINGVTCDCTVELGGPLSAGSYSEYVAHDLGGENLHVFHYSEVAQRENLQRVLKIEIQPRQRRPLSIALLEDDRDALELSCIELKQRGLNPFAFHHVEDLGRQIEIQKFDVIVLDWWIDGVDVGELIVNIRKSKQNANSMIAVVTGELRAGGNAREEVIERFITKHRVKTYIKPAHWSLLAAEWQTDVKV